MTAAVWVCTSAALSWTISNLAYPVLGVTFDPGLPSLVARWAPLVLPLMVAPLTTIPRVRLQNRLHEANEQLREEVRRRAELQAELEHQSRHDPLTDVLNRRGLFEAARVADLRDATLLLVDLDRFKNVNDAHGHAAGDAVLVALAHELRMAADPCGGLVGRLGGDEFVALLPAGQQAVADRLQARLRQLVVPLPGGPDVTVSASVGTAQLTDGRALDAALTLGDAGMYRDKQRRTHRAPPSTATPAPVAERAGG